MTTEATRGSTAALGRAASTAPTPVTRQTATSRRASTVADRHRSDWRRRYARFLALTDFIIIVSVVFGAQVGWLGFHAGVETDAVPRFSYTVVSIVLVVLWMFALALNDTRSDRVIGVGADEYRRIFDASFMLFGLVAIFAFLAKVELARGYLLIALPLGVFLLIAARYLWRVWLRRRRAHGAYAAKVILVGSARSVLHTARELRRARGAGYHVVAACVPRGAPDIGLERDGVPIVGEIQDVERAMVQTGADTVVITSTDEIAPRRVKEISWALEAGRQHLVLAPSITDIAGPRIHMRPVAGLPLMHVETPTFSSGQRFAKRMMDLFASIVLVVLASPAMLVLAALVKFTSRGPVIYRQKRVGRHGREFEMLKFRSMVADADAQLQSLLDLQDMGNGVLFKMKNDPRVTKVGRFMRKFSLDELPQLFNVLGGSMSLVGPRPPLQREVEKYEDHVHRRFLVKPGITGLWQVSGRSSLSWDDSVRLDLSYVENWSVMGDIVIMFKTVKAVVAPGDTVA